MILHHQQSLNINFFLSFNFPHVAHVHIDREIKVQLCPKVYIDDRKDLSQLFHRYSILTLAKTKCTEVLKKKLFFR